MPRRLKFLRQLQKSQKVFPALLPVRHRAENAGHVAAVIDLEEKLVHAFVPGALTQQPKRIEKAAALPAPVRGKGIVKVALWCF